MQSFVEQHRALILRHARAVVRLHAEKIALEDVAREMELELGQLAKQRGLTPEKIESPDLFLRAIAKHALGRAKRRRTLIEQLAAGDDLDALSTDLAELDSDLPSPPLRPLPRGSRRAAPSSASRTRSSRATPWWPRSSSKTTAQWTKWPTSCRCRWTSSPSRASGSSRKAASLGIAPAPGRDERRGGP